MQFITYFELNENMPESERLASTGGLQEKGLFPPEGVTIIRWDATPDGWGVAITEADTAEQVFRALNVWRIAGAGFFKMTKTSPSLPVQEAIPIAAEINQAVNG